MFDTICEFLKELPSVLVFGIAFAFAALIAVFIPGIIGHFFSLGKSNLKVLIYSTVISSFTRK